MYLKVFCIICMWLIMKLLLHGIDLFFFLFFNLVLLVALRGKLTVILVNSYLNDGMCFLLSLETSWHLQDWFYVTRKQPGPVTYSFICGVVQQTIEQPAKIHSNVFLYLSWKWIMSCIGKKMMVIAIITHDWFVLHRNLTNAQIKTFRKVPKSSSLASGMNIAK